jgi:hypothetical protein
MLVMAYTRHGWAQSPAWARYGPCKSVANGPKMALASQLELVAPIKFLRPSQKPRIFAILRGIFDGDLLGNSPQFNSADKG